MLEGGIRSWKDFAITLFRPSSQREEGPDWSGSKFIDKVYFLLEAGIVLEFDCL